MKKDIHPKYNSKAKAICACGQVFEVGSVDDELKVDLCSACHPFYTGKQKLVDTARRVEKFQTKAKSKVANLVTKKVKLAAKAEKQKAKKAK